MLAESGRHDRIARQSLSLVHRMASFAYCAMQNEHTDGGIHMEARRGCALFWPICAPLRTIMVLRLGG